MSKRNWIILSVVIVLAVVIIIGSKYYPPSPSNNSTGSIGVVKKYNAGQLSEKDVKLKNLMLKDITAVKASIEQLKSYKSFVNALSLDLGKWNSAITDAKKNSSKGLKDEKLLIDNSSNYNEYKNYIDKNIGTIDTAIALLTKISTGDTLKQSLEIEKTLTNFENFRIQVADKFQAIFTSLPNVHNALVKNGILGVIGNKEGNLGIVVFNKDGNLGLTNSLNAAFSGKFTLGCFNKENINGAILNKDGNYNISLDNKLLVGSVEFYSKNGSLQVVNNKEFNQVFVFNKDNDLGAILNKEGQLGVVMNKDGQLGEIVMNKAGN
jgi:hypothetical protein